MPTAAEKAEKEKDLKRNVKMTEHKEDINELIKRLGTDVQNGLTDKQVTDLRAKWGLNRLTPPKEMHIVLKFLLSLCDFFSLLLWGGSLLCFIGYALEPGSMDNLYLGSVLFIVVLATGIFGFVQNMKSDNLMKSFANMLPPKVMAKRDGKDTLEEAVRLVPGDIVIINAGDLVPADLRILECSDNLIVDNASLTGESEPQKRKVACTNDDPLETQNLCFFGTQVPEGSCTAVVIATGDNTVMGRIASLAMQTNNEQTPINRELENFIHIISAIAIALGVTFAVMNAVRSVPVISNVVFVIGIIVANVPEGLITTVTVCLTLTANRMHTKMVLVKNLEGVETLGSTSCICSDKTGTLTQNIMTVAQIVYGGKDGFAIEDCESSFSKAGKSYDEDSPSFKALCDCATLCNVAQFDEKSKFETNEDNEFITNPDGSRKPVEFYRMREQGDGSTIREVAWKPVGNASEAAMIKFIHPMADIDAARAASPAETTIPFNSKNKYQVHVHVQPEFNAAGTSAATTPAEIIAGNKGARMVYMKGAPERIFGRCNEVIIGDDVIEMTPELLESIDKLQSKMSCNGLRVLGFAKRELDEASFPPGFKYDDGKDLEPPTSTPNFALGDSLLKSNEFGIAAAYNEAVAAGTVTKSMMPPHENAAPGLQFIGLMALIDPPRPAVPGAVKKCKTAGIKVIMVTGDHPDTAKAISHKVGILWGPDGPDLEAQNEERGLKEGDADWVNPKTAQAIVVPGWTIDVSDPESKWNAILSHPQIVFARTSPQQKLVIVSNCQRLGHIVAVTGDGVNDSPAIKKADIGIAMGIAGTPVTKNAGDMILLDDNFASIVAGVEEGRLIFDNLKKSICYTLTSNIPEISPFLCMIVFATPLPLTTILILAIDLGTDMVPAISMAYEEAEADIMRRPPRDAVLDRLVTRKLIFFAYFQIGIMQAMSGFFTWMVILNDYGFPPHILPALDRGKQFGNSALYCRFSGGQYVNSAGMIDTLRDPTVDAPVLDYPLWDTGDSGYLIDCEFPIRHLIGGGGKPQGFNIQDSSTYSMKTEKFGGTAGQSTIEVIAALEASKYFEYIPWRGRMSPFWHDQWLTWRTTRSEGLNGGMGTIKKGLVTADGHFSYTPIGVWSLCLSGESKTAPVPSPIGSSEAITAVSGFNMEDNLPWCAEGMGSIEGKAPKGKSYKQAVYCDGSPNDPAVCADLSTTSGATNNINTLFDRVTPIYCDGACSPDCTRYTGAFPSAGKSQCANIASRMIQKEALHHGQAGYWVSIVVVQWADLLICKTRWLSIRAQGLRNSTLNFGLFFETLLAAWLCYCPVIAMGLGTRPLRFTHWMPGIPWSILIFVYDECRKYLMRATSPEIVDPETKRVKRLAGWIELNTYY